MRPLTLMTVVGARPEFIKAAPLTRALAAAPGLQETLVHTGQHYDFALAGSFFTELELPAPVALDVGSGSHGAQTGRALELLDGLMRERRPDLVIVYGDTNSTLAGALAAAKLGIPLAHVEAGLRSRNPTMPEEINRRLTDHLASLLFCPSPHAAGNLATEGIAVGVAVTGDVNLDAMRLCLPSAEEAAAALSARGVEAQGFALATVHRAENTDDPTRLAGILEAFGRIARRGLPIVFPIHPRTAARLPDSLPPGVLGTEPTGFRDVLALARHARVGLTDSGGLQKELFWLGTPCVTLRAETEWVETVALGRNTLAGSDPDAITTAALAARRADAPPPPVYGDGHAAEAISARIAEWAKEAA